MRLAALFAVMTQIAATPAAAIDVEAMVRGVVGYTLVAPLCSVALPPELDRVFDHAVLIDRDAARRGAAGAIAVSMSIKSDVRSSCKIFRQGRERTEEGYRRLSHSFERAADVLKARVPPREQLSPTVSGREFMAAPVSVRTWWGVAVASKAFPAMVGGHQALLGAGIAACMEEAYTSRDASEAQVTTLLQSAPIGETSAACAISMEYAWSKGSQR